MEIEEKIKRSADIHWETFREASNYSNEKNALLSKLLVQTASWIGPFVALYIVSENSSATGFSKAGLIFIVCSILFAHEHARSEKAFWSRNREAEGKMLSGWNRALWASTKIDRERKLEAAKTLEEKLINHKESNQVWYHLQFVALLGGIALTLKDILGIHIQLQ